MAWGRLDDGFGDHPKVLDLIDTLEEMTGAAAIGLWTLALAYANKTKNTAKTPGFIPRSFARSRGRVPASLGDRLVDVGLWEQAEGGWIIHDFADYLPSQDLKSKRAEAGRKGAEARWGKVAGQEPQNDETPDGDSNLPSEAMMANGKRCPIPNPIPKEKTSSSSTRSKPKNTEHPRFPTFWDAYAYKVGKNDAIKAFNAAVEDGTDPEAIVVAAGAHAERRRQIGKTTYILHPATWLNGKHWDDDLDAAMPLPAAGAQNQPPAYGQPAARPAASCRWCDNGLYERIDGRMARCEHTDQPPAGHPAAELTRSTS